MMVTAHAGHWATSVMFLVPTVAFVGWLAATTAKEHRRNRREGHPDAPPAEAAE